MAPRKKISDKLSDAIELLQNKKVAQAINILESMRKKAEDKESGKKTKREPNKYNIYVKDNFKRIQKESGETDNRIIMKLIGDEWKKSNKSKK